MFACQECNRKFRSIDAANRAANNGCPGCGGVDIDVARVAVGRDKSDYQRQPAFVSHALTAAATLARKLDADFLAS